MEDKKGEENQWIQGGGGEENLSSSKRWMKHYLMDGFEGFTSMAHSKGTLGFLIS
jgi:hypothetical protein